ncbi:hypothetical protein CVS40_10996 [Lucilia cuprina]|nr:hypothetical protein CVS40_10996 [Lucilia cuprina]
MSDGTSGGAGNVACYSALPFQTLDSTLVWMTSVVLRTGQAAIGVISTSFRLVSKLISDRTVTWDEGQCPLP